MKYKELESLALQIDFAFIYLTMSCYKFNRENICTLRRWIAEEFFHLDVNKDYFELSPDEICRLETFAKCCGFNGRNYLGRSKTRQFWYHLQKGVTKPF